MIRIGLLSEDRALQPLLASALGKDFQVELASSEEEVERQIRDAECDVLILDLALNAGHLKERIEWSHRTIALQLPVVVLADDAMRATALELVRLGAFGYCRRPPSIRELKAVLSRASETSLLRRQLQTVPRRVEPTAACDRLIGSSPQIRQVYQLVNRVCNLNATVLVTGESGTGKELIARAIHNLGSGRTAHLSLCPAAQFLSR